MFHSALGLFFIGLLALPGSAAAADASFCKVYAEKAASEAALAERLACAFHGPRWTSDIEAHRVWCLGRQESVVQEEAAVRSRDVRLCMCDWYAKEATAQAARNTADNCQFEGPRWTPDESAHYRWCVLAEVPLATLESEIATRKTLLAECAKH